MDIKSGIYLLKDNSVSIDLFNLIFDINYSPKYLFNLKSIKYKNGLDQVFIKHNSKSSIIINIKSNSGLQVIKDLSLLMPYFNKIVIDNLLLLDKSKLKFFFGELEYDEINFKIIDKLNIEKKYILLIYIMIYRSNKSFIGFLNLSNYLNSSSIQLLFEMLGVFKEKIIFFIGDFANIHLSNNVSYLNIIKNDKVYDLSIICNEDKIDDLIYENLNVDLVVIVEGKSDKNFFDFLINYMFNKKLISSDYKIRVISIGGKMFYKNYINKFKSYGINTLFIGDIDCLSMFGFSNILELISLYRKNKDNIGFMNWLLEFDNKKFEIYNNKINKLKDSGILLLKNGEIEDYTIGFGSLLTKNSKKQIKFNNYMDNKIDCENSKSLINDIINFINNL